METFGWLILLFPLAGAVTIGLTWRLLPWRVHGMIGTAAIAGAFVCSVLAFLELQSSSEEEREGVVAVAWDYASSVGVDAQLSILLDPLSILMCLVVTGVSTLIHLYSTAYMVSDQGYTRFFAYLNFFVFSMLLLVLAGNFLLLIIGWAFVGAASYLLISFWYRRRTATQAGIKAFVINVVGDVGLVLGTYFILKHTGTLDFLGSFEKAGEFARNDSDLVAGLCLLLVGAFAKSAQVPFHTWLPDAMEGPTPVSALIHAATMVTAGVYLIARMHPLFEQAPIAADVGAIVGCATLLIAATIGLVVTDLKRVIAYSTMSQIGYMIMGVSSAAYSAGMFHLTTHAFFKALLFMAAGSVISAMAMTQDLDRMGGFRKALPFTYAMFIVGGLALSGVPPFAGLFSKDEIISVMFERGDWHVILGVLGYLGSFLTAVYTFRMIFRAFHGEPVAEARELENGHLAHAHVPTNPANGEEEDTDVGFPGSEHHIAERSFPMKAAMGVLAIGATGLGFLQLPGVTHAMTSFLEPTFHDSELYEAVEPSTGSAWIGLVVGAIIGIAGVALAYQLWVRSPETPGRIRARLHGLWSFFSHKWYFDEAIDAVIVRPCAWFGRFARNTFERLVVNGVVDGSSGVVRAGSAAVRAIQSGFLRAYAALLLLGLAGLALYFLIAAR